MKHKAQIRSQVLEVNHQFIAANKPAGMPVQGDQTGDHSLLELLNEYARQELFLINRLDRPVSGVVLFARKKSSAAKLSQQFAERKTIKRYLAVTENGRTGEEVLEHWIKKLPGSAKVVQCEPGEKDAQRCELPVTWLAATDRYSLCMITPVTGFTHQIRAQLAFSGSPIKGDVKYGARRKNKDRSIHLHAWQLEIAHPVTSQKIKITAPLPEDVLWDLFYEKGIIEKHHE
jgi:23S rRNA pseudouridine1911/1915/1917 synthase